MVIGGYVWSRMVTGGYEGLQVVTSGCGGYGAYGGLRLEGKAVASRSFDLLNSKIH